MKKCRILICLTILAVSSFVLAQERRPLSVADVEKLLKGGVSQERVAELVEERGVNFEVTEEGRKRLRGVGADARVMQAVERGALAFGKKRLDEERRRLEEERSKAEEDRRRTEQERQKAEEEKRGIEEARRKDEEKRKAEEEARRRIEEERRKGKDGAEMVLIPAGEFWMGSEDSDSYANEKPRRRVYLDAFRIDRYEVTNALYKRFMDAASRAAPSSWNDSKWNEPNQPVVGVDWNDATAYCSWAGKRLPTEAEWEKAARGTDGRKYPWGEQWDASRANSRESKLGKTVAVGSYSRGASPYGAHDMAGNVREWVADWYDANYYQRALDRNPRGPDSGQSRVLRGGSWSSHPRHLRGSDRYRDDLTYRGRTFGFRCAQ